MSLDAHTVELCDVLPSSYVALLAVVVTGQLLVRGPWWEVGPDVTIALFGLNIANFDCSICIKYIFFCRCNGDLHMPRVRDAFLVCLFFKCIPCFLCANINSPQAMPQSAVQCSSSQIWN